MDVRGYRGRALQILSDASVSVGDMVSVSCSKMTHEGIIMPRYEHTDDLHIVLKLKSGYNVGIDIQEIDSITVSGKTAEESFVQAPDPQVVGDTGFDDSVTTGSSETRRGLESDYRKKKILLLSTGGTIASRIDYRTGAVTPILSADDLLRAMPELSEIADFDSEVVTSVYSENMTPNDWLLLARRILERVTADAHDNNNYAGVIVAHGTDTMHYTSAFLSFALAGFPVPIVLTGAQRSPDRASSDAAANLAGAARFIAADGARGVYVAMHMDGGDDKIACHIGTRVRKNHTSKRDAFETIGSAPAFTITGSDVTGRRIGRFYDSDEFSPAIALDERVALIKYHPGFSPDLLGHIIDSDYKAIIFEGTGLGHVGSTLYEQIKRASKKKIFLGMTSQCVDGRTAMTVYESGRDLLNMGVVPLNDMIPEVALVKAMWAAGNYDSADEIKEIMLKNVASEMSTD